MHPSIWIFDNDPTMPNMLNLGHFQFIKLILDILDASFCIREYLRNKSSNVETLLQHLHELKSTI